MKDYADISDIHSKEEAMMEWIKGYIFYHNDILYISDWMSIKDKADNFYDLLIEKYKITYEELVDCFELVKTFE